MMFCLSGSEGTQRTDPHYTNGNGKTIDEDLRSEEKLLEVSGTLGEHLQ